MIIVTTNDIAGYRIDASRSAGSRITGSRSAGIYGEAMGLTMRSRHIGASLTASLQSAPLAV